MKKIISKVIFTPLKGFTKKVASKDGTSSNLVEDVSLKVSSDNSQELNVSQRDAFNVSAKASDLSKGVFESNNSELSITTSSSSEVESSLVETGKIHGDSKLPLEISDEKDVSRKDDKPKKDFVKVFHKFK